VNAHICIPLNCFAGGLLNGATGFGGVIIMGLSLCWPAARMFISG